MPLPVQFPSGQPSNGKLMHDTAEFEKERHEQAWAHQEELNRETIEVSSCRAYQYDLQSTS